MAKETFDRIKPYVGQVSPPNNNITEITTTVNGAEEFAFEVDFDGDDNAAYIWKIGIAAPVGRGTMSISNSRIKLACTMANTGLAGTMDLDLAYTSRFGAPQVDSKIFVSIKMIDSVSGTEWDFGVFSSVVESIA